MQRRAAAAYVAIFVLLAAGSYGVIATSNAPPVTLQQSEVDVSATTAQNVTIDGTAYDVTEITETESGGGHGGATTTTEATIEWVVPAEETETLENGTVVERDGANWTVVVPNETGISSFELVETFALDRPTVTQDGTTYVVFDEGDGGNRTLVPRSEYVQRKYGETRTRTVSEGDAWTENFTVGNVTAGQVVLVMETTETQSVTVAEGANVTLGDTTYTAHFPSTSRLELTTDYQAYEEETAEVDRYHQRLNGFWMVAVFSGLTGVGLLALAYLPNK